MMESKESKEAYFKQRLVFEKKVRKFFDKLNKEFSLCSICFVVGQSCCHPKICNTNLKHLRKDGYSVENDSEYHYDGEYRIWVINNVKKSVWKNDKLDAGCPLALGKSLTCITFSCNQMRDFFDKLGSGWRPSRKMYKKISHLLHSIHNTWATSPNLKRNILIMKNVCKKIDELFRDYNILELNCCNKILPDKFGWKQQG